MRCVRIDEQVHRIECASIWLRNAIEVCRAGSQPFRSLSGKGRVDVSRDKDRGNTNDKHQDNGSKQTLTRPRRSNLNTRN